MLFMLKAGGGSWGFEPNLLLRKKIWKQGSGFQERSVGTSPSPHLCGHTPEYHGMADLKVLSIYPSA